MSDIKVGDTVYFEDVKVMVSNVGYCDDLLLLYKVGSKSYKREELETEKEYFARKLAEIEEEEKKPVWPLSPETPHYYYFRSSYDHIEVASSGLVVEGESNQALSKERCIQLREKNFLQQDMYLWVDTFYPDWKPDWSNFTQRKYGILDGINREPGANPLTQNNFFCFGISVPTKEAAEEMEKVFGERLKEWY